MNTVFTPTFTCAFSKQNVQQKTIFKAQGNNEQPFGCLNAIIYLET